MIFVADAIPHKRYRRQLEPNKKANLPYEGWAGGSSNPSGAPGAYYGEMISLLNSFCSHMLLSNCRYWGQSKLWWNKTAPKFY